MIIRTWKFRNFNQTESPRKYGNYDILKIYFAYEQSADSEANTSYANTALVLFEVNFTDEAKQAGMRLSLLDRN